MSTDLICPYPSLIRLIRVTTGFHLLATVSYFSCSLKQAVFTDGLFRVSRYFRLFRILSSVFRKAHNACV